MNYQIQNNQPTFVFKTSSISLEIAENMKVKTIILVMYFLILMEMRNEQKDDRPYTVNVSSTIEKTNHSCHDGL